MAIHDLTPDEARALLEARAQRDFGVTLDQFIDNWFADVYGVYLDDDPKALELAMLLPVVGINPWLNARPTHHRRSPDASIETLTALAGEPRAPVPMPDDLTRYYDREE